MAKSDGENHKIKGDLPGTPKDMGPPKMIIFPYYSHIFMVPENPIDKRCSLYIRMYGKCR